MRVLYKGKVYPAGQCIDYPNCYQLWGNVADDLLYKAIIQSNDSNGRYKYIYNMRKHRVTIFEEKLIGGELL